jgi:hypothetical protein
MSIKKELRVLTHPPRPGIKGYWLPRASQNKRCRLLGAAASSAFDGTSRLRRASSARRPYILGDKFLRDEVEFEARGATAKRTAEKRRGWTRVGRGDGGRVRCRPNRIKTSAAAPSHRPFSLEREEATIVQPARRDDSWRALRRSCSTPQERRAHFRKPAACRPEPRTWS